MVIATVVTRLDVLGLHSNASRRAWAARIVSWRLYQNTVKSYVGRTHVRPLMDLVRSYLWTCRRLLSHLLRSPATVSRLTKQSLDSESCLKMTPFHSPQLQVQTPFTPQMGEEPC